MAFNDIFRLRVYQTMHGSQVVNVMHFVQTDVVPGAGAMDLANDFINNLGTSLRARAVPDTRFDYVEVQTIVPFSGAAAVANFPVNTFGTGPGASGSATLCEVITIYTSRAGRRGRGRIYLPSADTSSSTAQSGVWSAPQSARTQTFATAMYNRYMGSPDLSGFRLGVWSRKIAGPTPPWTTDAFVRATALTVRTTIRTQRRRQRGVGR